MKRAELPQNTEEGRKLLAIVKQYPGITTAQIILETQGNPTTTRRKLDRLAGQGMLTRTGKRPHKWYLRRQG
ncbi:MAG: hypothetical protein KME15_20250 [Drouetiella hepatica Uher 2000/2452]|uniref:Uncharacterized protein n=1 Tax=Drouetiella hepatica Uher 2000/2452 TaxID=904376 RepID=A0A951QEB9_9CYAN|nr:hypothetical protein [Drouetiella hepatica Uher 2000/2452]